jgi:hypothetical protein
VTPLTRAAVSVYTVPTDGPESDGRLEWTSTTIIIVEVAAGGVSGLGYTYGHKATAALVSDVLAHFYDHERMLFDGALEPVDGMLRPDLSRPGLGLELKRADANRYAA